MSLVRSISITILGAMLNALYRICDVFYSRQDLVLFVSRQSNEISLDYQCLGKEYERRNFLTSYLVKTLDREHIFAYIIHVLKEIKQLAKCRICVLDGYDPVVSLLNFQCEDVDQATSKRNEGLYLEYPSKPVVLQLWHAFGAFKKFGFQAIGTDEGRSEQDAKQLKMHRNYSWIFCTGEACRKPFSEAFRYPIERILVFGRPEQDVLLRKASELRMFKNSQQRSKILFAPTLRRKNSLNSPFRCLYQEDEWKTLERYAEVNWAFHPVESKESTAENTRQLLLKSDYVVTDYSSIVYEAYLLNKKVIFYVPDIELYSKSPGLNVDLLSLKGIVFKEEEQLLTGLLDFVKGSREYPYETLEKFARDRCDKTTGVCLRIVDASLSWVRNNDR